MGKILYPLYYAVAWIMVGFHRLLSADRAARGVGATWALSIVGLVIVIRIILIPLFVKQINASARACSSSSRRSRRSRRSTRARPILSPGRR